MQWRKAAAPVLRQVLLLSLAAFFLPLVCAGFLARSMVILGCLCRRRRRFLPYCVRHWRYILLLPLISLGALAGWAGLDGKQWRCARFLPLPLAGALAEWLRGILFTGFPWLAIGYSQTEPSPLSGWLPLLGIDGVNLAVALLAVFFVLLMRRNMRTAAVMGIICIIGGGLLLTKVSWTTGKGHISVSLLQGNVPQSLKWQAGAVEKAMRDYLSMAKQASGKLIILPETALPIRWSDIPADYLQSLQEAAGDGAILAGLFMEDNGLHNAAAVLDKNGIGADYRKRHLTPYGEYLPFANILSPLLLAADIPYFSLSAGKKSAALPLLSTFAGISICYEDAFGDEWRSQLPAAQFLVNMTNDGWFDGSVMLAQHLQISQVRAAEFGRWLARATNTGLTAIINHKGEIVDFLPPQTQGILAGDIDLRIGATPLVRWGIWPSLLLSALLLLAVWAVGWRRSLRQ